MTVRSLLIQYLRILFVIPVEGATETQEGFTVKGPMRSGVEMSKQVAV